MKRTRCGLFFLLTLSTMSLPASCSAQRNTSDLSSFSDLSQIEGQGRPAASDHAIRSTKLVKWSGKVSKKWQKVDQLIEEQKLQAATKLVEDILVEARNKNNSEDWVRALVRLTQLRIGLHGYETSVRFLKEQPWPNDLLASTTLQLYYAASLELYAQSYSREILQRKKIQTKDQVDLKAWTMEQIFSEAYRAYAQVWRNREQLGQLPNHILKEYIRPNNYGDKIRPSLRDAVSYLWVALLENQLGWRPQQTNQIYQLDLERLLGNQAKSQVDLVDPKIHPLKKIGFILDDLESFHENQHHLQAAFSARLEKLSRFHSAFTGKTERQQIQDNLRQHLDRIKGKAWWSVGMATLANFVKQQPRADNLIQAHKIALRGMMAYPESIGGKRCANIAESIEMPAFEVEGMATDNQEKRSIAVDHKNLDALFFRAYRFDLKKEIESSDDYGIYPQRRRMQKILKGRKPDKRFTIELKRPKDFKQHRKYIVPPLDKPGLWAVLASARENFQPEANAIRGIWIVISDLVLLNRFEDGTLHTTVLSGETGKPIAGADVLLYRYNWKAGHRAVAKKRSHKNGQVKFGSQGNESYFVFAQKGDQASLDPSYQFLARPSQPNEKKSSLLFTDRSVYRPQQTIHVKVVAYRGWSEKASFRAWPNTRIKLSLLDPNNQRVKTKSVTTNRFGTASCTFVIPTGRLLGRWRITSSASGQTWIQVEEYKRPTFEVRLLDPEQPLALNQRALLKGQAKYYFGLPVATGVARYTVTRTALYPWWYSYYRTQNRNSTQEVIASGSNPVSADGTFAITFFPKADPKLDKDVNYAYEVSAKVTDEGGETRTSRRVFRLGFVAVQARVQSEVAFFLEHKPAKLVIVRSDLNATPKPGEGQYQIVAIQSGSKTLLPAAQPLVDDPTSKRDRRFDNPDDARRPRWKPAYQPEAIIRNWPDGAKRAEGTLTHDAKGEAMLKLPDLKAGPWRIKYQSKDEFGKTFEMSHDFLVVSPKHTQLALPALLKLERTSVKVGETARLLALSGLADQMLYLDIFRKGKLAKRRRLQSGQDANLLQFPIKESDRGGFSFALTVLRDHQLMRFTSGVFVPWDNKELTLSFSTFRDKLQPGKKETWKVNLHTHKGAAVGQKAAEVLAYMYDRSLDAFAPHNPPTLLGLYPSWNSAGWARTNLGQAKRLWLRHRGFPRKTSYPTLQNDRLRFFERYGIGGVGRRNRIFSKRKMSAHYAAPMSADLREGAKAEAVAPKRLAGTKRSTVAVNKINDKEVQPKPDAIPNSDKKVELRENFAETAFFKPHLLTNADGSVSIAFTPPDSVTSWNVWIHALTADLKSGSLHKQAQTIKELMVRPYLPRFLREGDQANLKVVVNNATQRKLLGKISFDIIDRATQKSILSDFGIDPNKSRDVAFQVEGQKGTKLSFAITTPPKLGSIALRISATSGDVSDGELREIPILPGRMHLAQSRFAVLKNNMRRELTFSEMKTKDASRINEQLVVTLDAQLFYSVLRALPYLVDYPYECTEQLLNRFLSTGILSSMYRDYPAVAKMAKTLAKRNTRLERFEQPDPNRKMALEETPWLQQAQGGAKTERPLIKVLDPHIAKIQRESSLEKLKKAQTSSGAFPWFPGGPPSPYITLYILHGFSKALEFGVEVPKSLIQQAWRYMHRHYISEIANECMARKGCVEFVTFLNYVLSNYPDNSWTQDVFSQKERNQMLSYSFSQWKTHSPYLKGYLALSLARAGKEKDAQLVWASVMDSAKQTKDQGIFWAPEDRAWLWYNDTIETHAFALHTAMELTPKDPKLDGMVLWLFINKKLNHWKSTKATSEVIYSLAHYLKKTKQLNTIEKTQVQIGDQKKTFVFYPDKYTGKNNQIVVPGEAIDPQKHATIVVETKTKAYQFASATWHFSTEQLPQKAQGDYLRVERKYFKCVTDDGQTNLEPLAEGARLEVGDEVEVQLFLRTKHMMGYLHLRDPRPAGFEPISQVSRHRWNLGISWYEEVRDSGQNFFFEHLPAGEYPFKYRLRATIAGVFKAMPACVQPMYAPEFVAYSSGKNITIEPSDN